MISTLLLITLCQAGSLSSADALFAAGRDQMKAGRYDEACPLFEQSYAKEKALGTLLNVANCNAKLGKLARARAAFLEAEDWAKKNHDSRATLARQMARGLEKKMGRVALSPAPGLVEPSLSLNGDPASPGSVAFVDPGSVQVALTAKNLEPWSTRVEVLAARTVKIALPKPAATVKEAPTQSQASAPVASAETKSAEANSAEDNTDIPVAEQSPRAPLTPRPAPVAESSTAGGAKSNGGGVALLTGGSVLLAGGVAGIAYSLITHDKFQRQQPGGPDAYAGTVTKAQVETLQWLYPASLAATALGAAAIVGGSVWMARTPPVATIGVIATRDGIFVPISGAF